MSLHVSWLSAGIIPGAVIAQRSVQTLSQSAQKTFGSLLQRPTRQANGPSEASPSKTNQSRSDQLRQIREELEPVVAQLRGQFTPNNFQDLEINSTGNGLPNVTGPADVASELRTYLSNHPEITNRINELAVQQSSQDPLQWMPNATTAQTSSVLRKPLRIIFPCKS